jgi:hypothetical protein
MRNEGWEKKKCPSMGVLTPDHHEGDHATHNLARKEKGRRSVRSRADAREEELWKNMQIE